MSGFLSKVISLFGLKEIHENSNIREDRVFSSQYENDLPYLFYLLRRKYASDPWFESWTGRVLYKLETSYFQKGFWKRKALNIAEKS